MLKEKDAKTLSFQYSSLLKKMKYDIGKKNYFGHIRNLFVIIAECNIRKSAAIQGGDYHIDRELLGNYYYEEMDFNVILNQQNQDSRDKLSGYISVLNTAVFIISNYKFYLA